MKTRFQISTNRSPSSSGLPGGPPAMWSPWSKKISEHGPQGPVSPIDQKLSLVGDADDPVVRQAGDLLPEVDGLVVGVVDGDQQLVGRQRRSPWSAGSRRGSIALLLEVVAEREVAQHLEEGVVAGGVADIVQVVVLAAGADALLRARPRAATAGSRRR